jgi:hypothetical protein
MSFYLKDPHSRIDYGIDWGPGYLGDETIAGSSWSVFPQELGGIEVDEAGFTATRTAATLSGGVAGHIYSVANHVTLSDGRSDDRSITLRVEQR